MNSSYWDSKFANHTELVTQIFSQGKFNSSKLFPYSTLYPHFIHLFHTIFKRNIGYTQNYTAKYKSCFTIFLKMFHLPQAKSIATLGIFIAKWISSNNSNTPSFYRFQPSKLMQNLICSSDIIKLLSCKNLGARVGTTLCQKLGAFCQLISANKQN